MILVRCLEADRKALESISVDPEAMQDDGMEYLDVKVDKPWGYETERYRNEEVSVWKLIINKHHETSMHCHPNKTTLLMVVKGIAELHTLEGQRVLTDGDVVIIEKGAFHKTISHSTPLVMYELETPPNKRDLVRLSDHYNRGQGYEKVGIEAHENQQS